MGALLSSELARLTAAVLAVMSIATLAPILNRGREHLNGPATIGIERASMQAGGLPRDPDMPECLKEEFADLPTTQQDYLNELPSRFKVEMALFSARPRVGGLTVFTSGSASRLFMLDAMCATWVGPLAVAILQPVLAPGANRSDLADVPPGGPSANTSSNADLASIEKEIRDLFARAEASNDGCQLDIMLMTELVADEQMQSSYPYNAVRNMAMLLARTELVLLMDIDFLFSKELNDMVLDPDRYAEVRRLALARHCVVLAAFRTEDWSLAHTVTAGGRAAADAAIDNGTLTEFSTLHIPTNLSRWRNTSAIYEVGFKSGYEPWCIMDRLQAPWFDVRFRGLGPDKINYLRVVNTTGFKFTVHHEAFIVHRPHVKVRATLAPGLRELWKGNRRWHHNSSLRLRNHTYTTPVTPAFKRCRAQLPWWNLYPPEGEPEQYRTVAVPYWNNTLEQP